jgi:hypothetical protein
MAYKTLFSVITDTALAGPVLDQAIAMATALDAHLDVLCMGLDRTQTGFYYAGANALILQETITRAQEEARAVEAHVRKILSASDVRWSLDSGGGATGRHGAARRAAGAVLGSGDPAQTLWRQARGRVGTDP